MFISSETNIRLSKNNKEEKESLILNKVKKCIKILFSYLQELVSEINVSSILYTEML